MSPKPNLLSESTVACQRNAGQGVRLADDGMGSFDLKDTLKGISVRDTSFGEFLAALKHYGKRTGKA